MVDEKELSMGWWVQPTSLCSLSGNGVGSKDAQMNPYFSEVLDLSYNQLTWNDITFERLNALGTYTLPLFMLVIYMDFVFSYCCRPKTKTVRTIDMSKSHIFRIFQ